MDKLELFAGESSLLFEIENNDAHWTHVYAVSKDQKLRLGALDFEHIRKNMLLNLPPPYTPEYVPHTGEMDAKFGFFVLMNPPASIIAEPTDEGALKLHWESSSKKGYTNIMTLSPEDVQAWIHTLETFEPNKLKRFTNLFKRRKD